MSSLHRVLNCLSFFTFIKERLAYETEHLNTRHSVMMFFLVYSVYRPNIVCHTQVRGVVPVKYLGVGASVEGPKWRQGRIRQQEVQNGPIKTPPFVLLQ